MPDDEDMPIRTNFRGLSSRIDDPAHVDFWRRFAETVGLADLEAIRAKTQMFGAKFANLDEMRQALGKLNMSNVEIPDYIGIPVSVYLKWRDGGDIRDDLRPFYEWIDNRSMMVRSSAVFAEDGGELTGAGIYDSKILFMCSGFDNFCSMVYEVYRSVDSKKAVEYRQTNDIPEEHMGILLQEIGTGLSGTVNTVLYQVPDLMEVRFKNIAQLIKRREFEDFVISGGDARVARLNSPRFLHHNADWLVVGFYGIFDLAVFCTLIERWYGQPVQIEFSIGNEDRTIYIFQIRPLPRRYQETNKVEFPDEEPLYTARAIGVGDKVLEVLDGNMSDTSKKDGVVVFNDTEECGGLGDRMYYLPRSGGVILLNPSALGRGHIETLCAERGLLCICPFAQDFDEVGSVFLSTYLKEHKNVRLVLNGLEGRVYPVTQAG